MEENTVIEEIGKCIRVIFARDSFMIALFDVGGEIGCVSVKGNMFVSVGNEYKIKAEHDTSNPKYQNSYKAIQIQQNIDFSNPTSEATKSFLGSFLTEKQVKAITDALPDPMKSMEDGDIETLVTVKGVGVATATRMIANFKAQQDYSEAFVAFAEYGLSDSLIRKICDHFGSVNEAISIVKANPYSMTQVNGIGFKKADFIFLSSPFNDASDIRRIHAFTDYVFSEAYQAGNTWISPKDYVSEFKSEFKKADFNLGIDYIKNSKKYVVVKADGNDGLETRITLKYALELELKCCHHLLRIANAESKMVINNFDKHLENVEKAQGWSYTEEQIEAIQTLLKNNVVMLQGLGGTGKSSCANAFLSAVTQNGYSHFSCALSGKAADNLTQTTGLQAKTIHGTLKVAKDGFYYKEGNPLPFDVGVLDELSMVNLEIFESLLSAIPTGGRLIMLGDFGQLEAIGVGVMKSLIKSKAIPMVLLKQIHRQAAKSAIITHSIDLRKGLIPKEIDFKALNESKVYGDNEDLEYIIVAREDEEQIPKHTMRRFKELLNKFPVKDIQIICSTRAMVADLNQYAQRIANPSDVSKQEIQIDSNYSDVTLRVGDKVINLKNQKECYGVNGELSPIYNGNTGIILSIDNDEKSLVVDFDGIGEVVVTSDIIKNIQLGYAITVHKSQGSTIPCVIYAMPFHFLLNTKEAIYTGMTRAKDYQVIITSERTLKDAARKTSASMKRTNLETFLKSWDTWEEEYNKIKNDKGETEDGSSVVL